MSNSIVDLLDGDGFDDIYHVIELVLLGYISSLSRLSSSTAAAGASGQWLVVALLIGLPVATIDSERYSYVLIV